MDVRPQNGPTFFAYLVLMREVLQRGAGVKAVVIQDPDAKKPDDWDEREYIDDPEDKKPDDWEKPEHIPDPEAKKPEDWDDEMDGEWEPPMIDNPEYKGEWKPKQIKNPAFKASKFSSYASFIPLQFCLWWSAD